MQTLFTILIALQFIVIITHDWLHISGWTHGRQVQDVIGRRKLAIATAINAIFPGLAVGYALRYWHTIAPRNATNYWVIYCAMTLGFAVTMWYLPYFFGASEEKSLMYEQMYRGTRHILPPRGRNPRPNLLHICFHVLFVINLVIAIGLIV